MCTFFAVLTALCGASSHLAAQAFVHPGSIHTQADLDRMKAKVAAGERPWIDGWNRLLADTSTLLSYSPRATANMGSSRQNADRDAHAAYNAFIRWYVSGDTAYGDKAVQIMNAWSSVVNQVPAGTDIPGLSGIPITHFAYVAELLRIYPGWSAADQQKFKDMLLTYWYPVCKDFLTNHNGTCDTHYWANWDIANIGAIMAIGVFCDDRAKFDEAIDYFKNGAGNGNIMKAVYFIHPNGLGQWQESGRDQGHAQLGVGMMAAFCELAWKQGVDLYGYGGNRLLAGAEYVARTQLMGDVPYVTYDNCDNVNQYFLASNALGGISDRPVWELIYNHYVVRKGLSAPNVKAMAEVTRPEHGSIDHFGYGTLTFTLDAIASPFPALPVPSAPTGLTASAGASRVYLKWNTPPTPEARGYIIRRATAVDGPFTEVGSWQESTWNEFTDTSVTAGTTYYYNVSALNASGTGAASSVVSATPVATSSTLPAGWACGDVGTAQIPATATYAAARNNTFTITGSGSGIGGNADGFGFAYTATNGDVSISAKLVSMGGSLGKMGLMIRESLQPDAPMIYIKVGDVGWRQGGFGYRSTAGGSTSWVAGNDYTWFPAWFKLERVGNSFTAYQSGDGLTWVAVGSANIPMSSTCYVGMAPGTTTPSGTGTGMFEFVTVTAPATTVPAAPTTVAATGVTSTQINLAWTSAPGASAYTVKRAASPAGPFATIATNLGGTSYSDTGLAWSTTYHYVVTAANLAGESADSAIASASTLAPNPPPAPGKVLTAAGDGRIVVSWSASTDATSYVIKRATSPDGPFGVIATIDGTSYTDTAVTNGTTYYYVVAASNVSGTSPDSSATAAAPAAGAYSYWPMDDAAGTTATDAWSARNGTLASAAIWSSGALNGGVKLNGTSSAYVSLPSGMVSTLTDFTLATWVRLDATGNWARLIDFGTSTSNYLFLAPRSGASGNGVRYAIRTTAVAEKVIDGPALSTGAWVHLAVTQAGNTAILYVNGVEVNRNTAMTLNPSSLGSTTQNYIGKSQFTADPYLNGTVDDLRLYSRSLSAAEVSGLYNALAPSAPANLTASGSASNVQLNWTAVPGAASYYVKRATTANGPFSVIASGVTSSSFTDTTATAGSYFYIVTARAGDFESMPSSAASILLPPAIPAAVTAGAWNSRVDVAWGAATGAVSYDVKRGLAANGPFNTIASVTTTTYSDTTVTNGTGYYYTVAAVNAAGSSADSAAAGATPLATADNTWLHRDVGSVGIAGNASLASDGTLTIYGSGADIWTQSDSFHFVYQPLNGDGAIMARVVSQSTTAETAGAAKAGVMIRESVTATSARLALVDHTPNNFMEFIRRGASNTNAVATTAGNNPNPRWVRLVRSGTTFTAYHSVDGVTWTNMLTPSPTVSMGTSAFVGLVFCANANTKLGQAKFDHVSLATAAPVITSPTSTSGTVDVPFSYTAAATQATVLFTATGLPAGLSINPDTGIISGTPTAAGTFPVSLTAINALTTTTATLNLTIAQGTASVSIGNTSATFDGSGKSVSVTTSPAGLNVNVTYDGVAALPVNAGSYAVTATINDANYVGSANGTLTILKAAAIVALSDLTATYDGTPKAASATTTPAGLTTELSYDGSATAPTNAGSYNVVATIQSANYAGSTTGTLVIGKATANVALSALSYTYDGTPKSATVTTTPAGLNTTCTYNGSATAPTKAGSYSVVCTVNEPNYAGSATGTLTIAKAKATMKLSPLAQRYDGLAKTVTATTTPADLTVNITYDGVDTGAVYPGPHTVVGTIQDENYEGTYTDTLVIGITALVRHAPTLNGELDGSLQLLSGESFSVNSSGLVSGDVLLPGAALVQLNGTSNVVGVKDGPGGVAPSNYNVTINSGAVVRYAVRRVDPIGVATVDAPPAPAGTRDVTLNGADQSAGDFATLRNLTLNSNSGSVAVPAGTYGTIAVNGSSTLVLGVANSTEPVVYNLQTLTVNSKAKVQVVGPVILTLGTASSFNGCVNGAGNPAILTLRIASGDLTLNSGSMLRASLIAPTSIVTLNSGSALTGEVVANYLVVNGVLTEP